MVEILPSLQACLTKSQNNERLTHSFYTFLILFWSAKVIFEVFLLLIGDSYRYFLVYSDSVCS